MNKPWLVAAATRSRVAGTKEPATAAGWRARRNTPNPSSWAMPVPGSHGCAPTAAAAGPIPDRTPMPPTVPPVADRLGTGSPVPSSTTSRSCVAPKATSTQPQLWAFTSPPRVLGRSAHPPTGSHVVPASGVYQSPPLAVAAYARVQVASTARSRIRPDTRGRPSACPRRVTEGPIGTHRSKLSAGNAEGVRRGAGAESSSGDASARSSSRLANTSASSSSERAANAAANPT